VTIILTELSLWQSLSPSLAPSLCVIIPSPNPPILMAESTGLARAVAEKGLNATKNLTLNAASYAASLLRRGES